MHFFSVNETPYLPQTLEMFRNYASTRKILQLVPGISDLSVPFLFREICTTEALVENTHFTYEIWIISLRFQLSVIRE